MDDDDEGAFGLAPNTLPACWNKSNHRRRKLHGVARHPRLSGCCLLTARRPCHRGFLGVVRVERRLGVPGFWVCMLVVLLPVARRRCGILPYSSATSSSTRMPSSSCSRRPRQEGISASFSQTPKLFHARTAAFGACAERSDSPVGRCELRRQHMGRDEFRFRSRSSRREAATARFLSGWPRHTGCQRACAGGMCRPASRRLSASGAICGPR